MPYVPAVMHGIEDELHDHGYSMLAGSNGSSREQQAGRVRRIVDEGVSGLIVYPIDYDPDPDLFARLAGDGLIVLIDRHLIGHAFDAVLADNVGGAFTAVTHLLEQGHRRIAFVSTDNLTTTSVAERLQGYQQALTAAGIPGDPHCGSIAFPWVTSWGDDYRVANKDNVSRIRRFQLAPTRPQRSPCTTTSRSRCSKRLGRSAKRAARLCRHRLRRRSAGRRPGAARRPLPSHVTGSGGPQHR